VTWGHSGLSPKWTKWTRSGPPKWTGTTTIESKTNFLSGALLGARVRGETTPVHRGRRTMVWQTRVTLPGGKLIALVTQTQLVL